jgi:hypothetical protein
MNQFGITGTEGLSDQQVVSLVAVGGTFRQFEETKAFLVLTFRSHSQIYFVRPGESTMIYAKKHIVITSLLVRQAKPDCSCGMKGPAV